MKPVTLNQPGTAWSRIRQTGHPLHITIASAEPLETLCGEVADCKVAIRTVSRSRACRRCVDILEAAHLLARAKEEQ